MKTFLILLIVYQILALIWALGIALARVGISQKWKFPDLFWCKRMEKFFVKIFTGGKEM